MKVSVLGAGNGGYALAFHLVQLGHEVLFFESDEFKEAIEPVQNAGCINALKECQGSTGEIHGVSKIAKTTTDIKEAMEFGNVAMLIIPSFGQGLVFEAALPYLTKDHIFISLPGNFAFLDYIKVMQKKSYTNDYLNIPFTLVETSSIPYACRKVDGNNVFVNGTKKMMHVGVYPSSRTQATVEKIKSLFSLNLIPNKNVIHTGLNNLNFLLHPVISLQNAGWIETKKGDFLFYNEGASPGVLRYLDALDQERLAIGKSFGFDMDNLLTVWSGWYGDTKSKTLEELIENAYFYSAIKAPPTLKNRYITEDINYVLAPIATYLAKKANIETPVAQALMTSAHVMTGLSVAPVRRFDEFPQDLSSI